jgi:hypothetical protein
MAEQSQLLRQKMTDTKKVRELNLAYHRALVATGESCFGYE